MQLALDLAVKAKGRTSPNPMVGAVIVKDGEIVGKGYHQKAGTPHAEIHALREAGNLAQDATMYVTLEPCSHHGRTPPCSEAIIKAGLKKVVVAMGDPNPLVAGRGINQLRAVGIEVEAGLLEDEAKKLNEIFIKYITTKTPFVLLKTAMTIDGKIATHTGNSRWITGPEARQQVHRLRNTYDGILVGIGTVLADNPSLTTRLDDFTDDNRDISGKDPIRIIVDSKARTPLDSKVLNLQADAIAFIAISKLAPKDKVEGLKAVGAKILVCDTTATGQVDLKDLMIKLGQLDITSVILEGGSQIAASALENELVDKVMWFIAPKIVGGQQAPSPVAGRGISKMSQALELKNIKIESFGEDISIEAYLNPR